MVCEEVKLPHTFNLFQNPYYVSQRAFTTKLPEDYEGEQHKDVYIQKPLKNSRTFLSENQKIQRGIVMGAGWTDPRPASQPDPVFY